VRQPIRMARFGGLSQEVSIVAVYCCACRCDGRTCPRLSCRLTAETRSEIMMRCDVSVLYVGVVMAGWLARWRCCQSVVSDVRRVLSISVV